MTWLDRLGISRLIRAFTGSRPKPPRVALKSAQEGRSERMRVLADEQANGIRPQWVPVSLDWRFEDIELVWQSAEMGNLEPLARFVEAMRHVGPIAGLMKTRSAIVRLPVRFSGDPFLCSLLRGEAAEFDQFGRVVRRGRKGAFRKMFPVASLIEFLYTGSLAGVAVAELIDHPVHGLPVMQGRDLHRLRFDWGEGAWFYRAERGEVRVTPGDGRWMLWTPYSDWRSWRTGDWLPLALAVVVALTATYDRSRYQGWHADPLKFISAPNNIGTDDVDRLEDFIRYHWQRAPGIVLKDGAEAGLVEANGTGYQVYKDQHEWAERWIQFVLSGQTVTSTGRGGLTDGGDLFRDIAENIIQALAESLGECVSEQGIAPWAWRFWGTPSDLAPTAEWDARSPQRRAAEANAITVAMSAVKAADDVLAPRGQRVAIGQYLDDQGIWLPIETLPGAPAAQVIDAAGEDVTALEAGTDDSEGEEAAPPGDAHADALAAEMTTHGVERCQHGKANRCWICGVERARGVIPASRPGEAPGWKLAWRAIPRPGQPLALPAAGTVAE